MNASQNHPTKKICEEHKLPIVFYHPNTNNQKGALCLTCLQKQTGLISGEIYEQIQQLINQSKSQNNFDKQQLEKSLNFIIEYRKLVNISLDDIINLMSDQIEAIHSFMKKMENIFDDKINQQISLEQIQKEIEDQKKQNFLARSQVQQKLQQYKADFSKIDHLIALPMEPELIKQPIELKFCHITNFVLSEYCNTLIVTKHGEILVYEFKNGIITNFLQKLNQEKLHFYCLYFMLNSNSLVSGGSIILEKSIDCIFIWKQDEKKKWFIKYGFKTGFQGSLHSIIMNKKKDLLVLAGKNYLGLWRFCQSWFGNDWRCEQKFDKIYCANLIMNESENIIIAFSDDYKFHILKLQKNKIEGEIKNTIWKDIQTIERSLSAVCFTIDYQFVARNETSNFLEVYDYEKKLKQFALFKEIKVDFGEPEFLKVNYFIKSKSIFATACGNLLNIFKVDKACNYQLIQKFQLNDYMSQHCFSDSGEYLIWWKRGQQEIQVMRLKFLE